MVLHHGELERQGMKRSLRAIYQKSGQRRTLRAYLEKTIVEQAAVEILGSLLNLRVAQ